MNGKAQKSIPISIVLILIIAFVLIQGCTMEHGKLATSPDEVLVMDLNSGSEYQKLLSGRPQTCGMRSGRVYLKPGETCGVHSTEAHEEMLIFLSGKGVALIGEEQVPYEVGAGKISYIPPYTIHNNKNTGTEPLVYIYCVTPVDGLEEVHNDADQDHHEEN